MKRRDHQSLSARNIELPLPFTLMANPSRDGPGPLDQARRALYTHHMHLPTRRVGCGGVASVIKKKVSYSYSNQNWEHLYCD